MHRNTYKDLIVWQKSTEVALQIYQATKKFPKDEVYGLSSQMRRAGVSIPSNIAEGKLRGHTKELRQFLLIAYGSAGELDTQLYLASKLGYISTSSFEELSSLLQEVMRMLHVMIRDASGA